MSQPYENSIFWVEIEKIVPNPFQPRREFDEARLKELADSIHQYGLLQPLTVTRKEKEHDNGGISSEYELIAGERRLRASKMAGLSRVPVIIRSAQESDLIKLELAIVENLQREDLNPVDRARAFKQLHEQFSMIPADIGRKVGKSREYVSNTIRILNLPESIQQSVVNGLLTEGHTRPLLMLNDRPEEQKILTDEIIAKKLTVRETESIARRIAHDKVRRKPLSPEVLALERELTETLGTRVTIEEREGGKSGKLVIDYFSADDLKSLLEVLRTKQEYEKATSIPTPTPVVDAAAIDDKPAVEKREEEDTDLYSLKNFSI